MILTITSGVQSRTVTIMRDDLVETPKGIEEVIDVLLPLLRQRVIERNATSNAQRKTALESGPFHL